MSLGTIQFTCVDRKGNIVPGATVRVLNEATGALATIYSDRAGATPLGNPFSADADGFAQFFAAGGEYQIIMTGGGAYRTWRYVPIAIGLTNWPDGTSALPGAYFENDLNTGLFRPAADTLAVSTGGVERARFDASGRFGIGATTPASKLHVMGTGSTDARIRLSGASSSSNYTHITDSGAGQCTINAISGSGQTLFDFAPLPGDGTSSALVRVFRETNTSGTRSFQVYRGNNTSTLDHRLDSGTSGTIAAFAINGGNVGVGTASPVTTLDVVGPVRAKTYTVATLPSASLGNGMIAFVSDANATLAASIGATVAGGGSDFVPVHSVGGAWKVG